MASYLDKTGVTKLWNKVKSEISDHSSAVLTATLSATGWSSNKQTVTVTGIKSTSNPVVDVKIDSTNISTIQNTLDEFAKVIHGTTADNSMTFYCSEAPTIDLTILIKGW